MIEHTRSLKDGQKGRGSVNTVQRQGDVIVRPTGAWSPAVHGLLQHLEEAGFAFSPRFVSVDSSRKEERLSYVHGEVALRPWPDYLRAGSGLEQVGAMLRAYHDSVSTYRPAPNSVWRDPEAEWQDGMIIRHGDLGPWNMVWESGSLVGLIDWDFAEPGYPIDDLAQAAWYCVPLRAEKGCREAGIDRHTLQDRLHCLCDSYGIGTTEVLEALVRLEQREIDRTRRLAAQGIEPWVGFKERGDIDAIRAELDWFQGEFQTG